MEPKNDFGRQAEPVKKHDDSAEGPENEGHVKEWQDRARVVLDAKEAVHNAASPRQSPPGEDIEDVEEKSENIKRDGGREASY